MAGAEKRCRYPTSKLDEHKGAYAKFRRDFQGTHFGFSCAVCDSVWFMNDLMVIGNFQDVTKHEH